ncbi:hypothetical protein KIW84_012577, partial [Lathyrus oleraceus]
NKTSFDNVQENVLQAKKSLSDIQLEIASVGQFDALQVLQKKAQADMDSTLNIEEYFWKEKARLNCNLLGDRKSKFFHIYAQIRKKTKLISSLYINNIVVTDRTHLENHIEDHFKNLFNNLVVVQDNGLIEETIPCLVNDSTNDILAMIPTELEIHNVVMNLNSDSAPRPDGFGAFFYQFYWEVIKSNVIKVEFSWSNR